MMGSVQGATLKAQTVRFIRRTGSKNIEAEIIEAKNKVVGCSMRKMGKKFMKGNLGMMTSMG